MTVDQRLEAILIHLTQRPGEEISFQTTWRNLGLDSLDLFDLVLAVEREFEVEIPDTTAIHFHCGADILRFLSNGHSV